MHENQNCPKRSLRDNTISSIVFQLDEKALCITARSHFCQLKWWSACKASITPATSKAFLPQANLMNLQTKILRSPGPFGLPANGEESALSRFWFLESLFYNITWVSQAFACLQETARSGERAGLGALWDFRACSNWISTGHVHPTSASHIFIFHLQIYLHFLEAPHRTEDDCLCLCYKTILYFIFEQKSRAKCAKMSRWDWEGAWGDRKCGLIAVILTHNDCHSCPDRSLPGLVATKRSRLGQLSLSLAIILGLLCTAY